MSDRKISYVNKDFNDFRQALVDYTKQYYPELVDSLNDASVGSWLVDMVAGVSDSLSYHIDRAFQETNINGAQQTSSLYNLARNNGVKIPGPKGAVTEIQLSCVIPVNFASTQSASGQKSPDWALAPIVRAGTQFSNGSVVFELDHDIDFSKGFDENGVPNRTIEVLKNSNEVITAYKVSKFFVVTAGATNVYKKEIRKGDITPFMEVLLPFNNVMSVESIIFKEGTDYRDAPSQSEFRIESEYIPAQYSPCGRDIYRFFEVDALIQPYRWGKQLQSDYTPIVHNYGYVDTKTMVTVPTTSISRGEWKPLRQKFMTEYTDKGYMKIIFGAGNKYVEDEYTLGDVASYSKHLITKMVNNDALGVTPKANTTMYILYKTGAGANSNLPKGSVDKIDYLNVGLSNVQYETEYTQEFSKIKRSFTVTNTTPAISGRDMMTGEELRNYIKYNKGSQDRCVTLNDYRSRILQMPAAYGTPYRVGVTEENNKVMVYLLGLDMNGQLSTSIPEAFARNLEAYLSEYRMINDYVEMKAGRIINLSFEIDCYINKSFNSADVVTNIINTVKNYMAIDKHQMGDDIFVGDIEREISALDGVINLIDLRVYNEFDGKQGYSTTQTTQMTKMGDCSGTSGEVAVNRTEIDLDASDHILYSENDTMLEIKYPEQNIKVRVKLK